MKVIRESTEFGLDMVRGLPRAYYYVKNKIPHKCIVKPRLVDMYKLISNNVIASEDYSPKNPPTLYQYTRPHWTMNEWEPPPLKKMFKKKKIILTPITFFKKLCSSSLKITYIVKRKNRVNINAVIR